LNDLKALGRMIEIVTGHGHQISTSTDKAVGNAGPNVSFGCDPGGAFVRVFGGVRLSLDDAKTLAADLFNALYYAAHREWLCDHGMAVRDEG
jgi:hypothetical protein